MPRKSRAVVEMAAPTGVTWTDIAACKAELARGLMPLLREQWRAIGAVEIPDHKRVECHEQDSPIRVLFRCISFGRYPPPELLMALQKAFDEYLAGDLTLEEAFFGKPPRRAGSYAQRNRENERNYQGALRYAEERQKPRGPRGGKGPAERAATGMPITGKALTRIVHNNPRLKSLVEAGSPKPVRTKRRKRAK